MNPELFYKIITSFHIIQGHINKLDAAYSCLLSKGKLKIQKHSTNHCFVRYSQTEPSKTFSQVSKRETNQSVLTMPNVKMQALAHK